MYYGSMARPSESGSSESGSLYCLLSWRLSELLGHLKMRPGIISFWCITIFFKASVGSSSGSAYTSFDLVVAEIRAYDAHRGFISRGVARDCSNESVRDAIRVAVLHRSVASQRCHCKPSGSDVSQKVKAWRSRHGPIREQIVFKDTRGPSTDWLSGHDEGIMTNAPSE